MLFLIALLVCSSVALASFELLRSRPRSLRDRIVIDRDQQPQSRGEGRTDGTLFERAIAPATRRVGNRVAGLLPASSPSRSAAAARARAVLDLVLDESLLPSARWTIERHLVAEVLRAPAAAWLEAVPPVLTLLDRPTLLDRLAARIGAAGRREEEAARAFLTELVRHQAYAAARTFLEAAPPGFLARWLSASATPPATWRRLERALDEPPHSADLRAVAGRIRKAA